MIANGKERGGKKVSGAGLKDIVQSQMVIQGVSCSLSGFFFHEMKLRITVLSLSQSLCKGHTGKHFQRQKFWIYTELPELGVVLRGSV